MGGVSERPHYNLRACGVNQARFEANSCPNAGVIASPLPRPNQVPHLHRQTSRHDLHAMPSHHATAKSIAKLKALQQQSLHAARKRQRAAGPAFDQRITPPKQVREALLMRGRSELVVDRPTVVPEDSRPVDPQQSLGWFDTSSRVHFVTRCRQSDERVQPSPTTSHSPASFVSDDLWRASYCLANLAALALLPLHDATAPPDCQPPFHLLCADLAKMFPSRRYSLTFARTQHSEDSM